MARLNHDGLIIVPYEEPGVGTLGVRVQYKRGTQQSHVVRTIISAVFKTTGVKITPKYLKDHGLMPSNHGRKA